MKTYHIITIGCQMNKSDSERLAAALEGQGYKPCADKHRADLVVVNTCGVRQSAENRIYGLIPRIKKENPQARIILTGCLAERKDVKRRLKNYVDMWLLIGQILNFKPQILKIPPTPFVKGEKCNDYLNIKPKYELKFSAFVPIGNGCDNFCSYCVVPYARGREVYRPDEEIVDEEKCLVKNGYKEIILIAQNVNSYKSLTPQPPFTRGVNSGCPPSKGGSGGLDFADLLKMVNNISGDFWVRFLTSHPKDMSQKLIKTMAVCEKVCRQVYLPVQAGDDEILKKMNRGYTVADYVKLVESIRKQLNPPSSPLIKGENWQPPVAITTDLIVGFPGETKKQFNNSLKLFKQVKFDMAYISEYSARPGTAAFKLADDVSRQEKKRRKNKLEQILRRTALVNNKKYIGKTVRVLVENRTGQGEWFGKTATGKDVRITNYPPSASLRRTSELRITNLIGKFVNVKITKAKEFCLAGEI